MADEYKELTVSKGNYKEAYSFRYF